MVRNRYLRIERGRQLTEEGKSKNRCGQCGQLKRGHVCQAPRALVSTSFQAQEAQHEAARLREPGAWAGGYNIASGGGSFDYGGGGDGGINIAGAGGGYGGGGINIARGGSFDVAADGSINIARAASFDQGSSFDIGSGGPYAAGYTTAAAGGYAAAGYATASGYAAAAAMPAPAAAPAPAAPSAPQPPMLKQQDSLDLLVSTALTGEMMGGGGSERMGGEMGEMSNMSFGHLGNSSFSFDLGGLAASRSRSFNVGEAPGDESAALSGGGAVLTADQLAGGVYVDTSAPEVDAPPPIAAPAAAAAASQSPADAASSITDATEAVDPEGMDVQEAVEVEAGVEAAETTSIKLELLGQAEPLGKVERGVATDTLSSSSQSTGSVEA